MPEVELAQQHFIRYPLGGESVACMHGWARSADALACAPTSVVRSSYLYRCSGASACSASSARLPFLCRSYRYPRAERTSCGKRTRRL